MTNMKKNRISRCLPAFVAAGATVFLTALATNAETADSHPANPSFTRLSEQDIPGLERRVNLTAVSAWDVEQIIDFLAHRGGLKNVVISPRVTGTTTRMRFDDVTVGEALEVVLQVNRLAYVMQKGIIKIMTDEEYTDLYGESFYDHREVRVVELTYADPNRLVAMLEPMRSQRGSIVADPVSGNMVLIDMPGRIRRMQAVIDKTDIATIDRIIPTETQAFTLQHADLEVIAREVEPMLSAEAGRVRVSEETRTLIVSDLPHRLAEIREMVELFDKAPRQVFIEAKIMEVTLSDDFSMGINWNHLYNNLDPRMELQTMLQPLRDPLASPTTGLQYGTIVGGGDLNVVLEAMEAYGETRILANPHVAVLDGHEARLEVVEEQPYLEMALEPGTTNIVQRTYHFISVGVQLGVTPRINDAGFVTCDILPEISSISQWYDGAPQEGTPVVRKSFAETSVRVKDGVTIVIGGMIRNEKSTRTSQVPLLGNIPLLGRLFRAESMSAVNMETVVFLTPRIITGEEPYRLLRDEPREPLPLRELETEELSSLTEAAAALSAVPAITD